MKQYFTAAGCCALAALMVVMLAGEAQAGQRFVVGGTVGWTHTANIDYTNYMSTYNVKVGDVLEFNNYDSTDHTAVEVDKEGYDTCGQSGQSHSSITIQSGQALEKTLGFAQDLYVICDIPSHCLQGQKVYVQVLNTDGTEATPSPSVNHTIGDSPPLGFTPSTSGASDLPGFIWTSQLMVVVAATFTLMVEAAFT